MKKLIGILVTIGILTILAPLSLTSCNSVKRIDKSDNTSQVNKVVLEEGGSQLWANNCARCHNSPPPNAYNDNEWDAIVNHMQKVGGFTVEDADKIADFLKASN